MHAIYLLVVGIAFHVVSTCVRTWTDVQHDQTLWAELSAWTLTLVYHHARPYIQSTEDRSLSQHDVLSQQSWKAMSLVAVPLVLGQYIEAFYGRFHSFEWTLPIITAVIYLLGQGGYIPRYHIRLSSYSASRQPHDALPPLPSSSVFPGTLTPAMITVSVFCSVLLSQVSASNLAQTFAVGLIYLCLAVTSYTALLRTCGTADEASEHNEYANVLVFLGRAAPSACATCVVCLVVSPVKLHFSVWVLLIGVLRAGSLVILVLLCSRDGAIAATSTATISSVIFSSFTSATLTRAAMYASMLGLTMVQAHAFLPPAAGRHRWTWAIVLLPFASLLSGPHRLWQSDIRPELLWNGQGLVLSSDHPVVRAFEDANAAFDTKLAGQSSTVQEAIVEYTRRYGRQPPRGFDRWFEIAKEADFQLIDEFDTVEQAFSPFWDVAPSDLRSRIDSLKGGPKLLQVKVRDGKLIPDREKYRDDEVVGYYADAIETWIDEKLWAGVLPDMTFYLNILDEPRIAVPHDKPLSVLPNNISWTNAGREDGWQELRSLCPPNSPSRQRETHLHSGHNNGVREQTLLPFVTNMTANKDVCQNSNLLDNHGFFLSPGNAMVSHTLVPIFSQCRSSIHSDLLIPSLHYTIEMDDPNPEETSAPPWPERLSRLYWAGSSTGGWATSSNWRQSHRMRLTLSTTPSSTDQPVQLLHKSPTTNLYHPITRPFSTIAHLFHTRITNIVQCSPSACDEMRTHFLLQSSDPTIPTYEPESASRQNKYALDIDGNTFSGRFYRLLKSGSCVLKHTAFDEWHDGRIVPWVHFIPVSSGAEELGELVRFLVEEEEGGEIGERVARQGEGWARRTLRRRDLEVGVVRVLLEYARLFGEGGKGEEEVGEGI